MLRVDYHVTDRQRGTQKCVKVSLPLLWSNTTIKAVYRVNSLFWLMVPG